MIDARYDISQLVQLAFNIKSPVFIPYPIRIGAPIPGQQYQGIEIEREDYGKTDTSWMGTPIVFPFTLLAGKYLVYNDNSELELKDFEDFKMPPVTLVDFDREKVMEETQTRGGKGSRKEIYGFGDWQMSVRGICLNEKLGGKKAQEYKEGLLKWESIVDTINVSGLLFSEKRIDAVVIKNIKLQQLEGKPGVIPFTFDMVSDYSLEIRL